MNYSFTNIHGPMIFEKCNDSGIRIGCFLSRQHRRVTGTISLIDIGTTVDNIVDRLVVSHSHGNNQQSVPAWNNMAQLGKEIL